MKINSKKILSLSEHKDMMSLLKQLYGDDEVKDDQKSTDTKREPGTKSFGQIPKLPPNCS
jgi:hypothetical protein